ncbi:uncharacterized protein LOC125944039 [Dermacentor silvarum]|uniref:uncharacterized protein LOC125944039 n=1 Tax=Dermacentor silvarum TaxID=543639 RepID=UPI0021010445|nr:uncharacterized protein LOC125944039 [Dermacentor silvarum]
MEVLMTKVSRQKEWALNTTLAVSVSLCTRVYMPVRKTGINDPCVDHMRRPNTTAAFCTDPVGIYDSPTTIRFGHVTVKSMSRSTPPLVATFDSNDTVGYKYCRLRRQFVDFPFGLAIFDLECEDWEKICDVMNTPIFGTHRFEDMTAHFLGSRNRTNLQTPCN